MSDTTPVYLPDGTVFPFWDDVTEYTHVYHVDVQHSAADDANPGTESRPMATINAAAAIARPGEKVLIHGGVYRECVRPACAGSGADGMICYQAAPGDDVCVRGSMVWSGPFISSQGFKIATDTPAVIWQGDLPPEWFMGYNPFMTCNLPRSEYTISMETWSRVTIAEMQKKRGMVFVNDRPLQQVLFYAELAKTEGSFWVEEPGLRIHFRLWDGIDPHDATIEVTTREQAFAPTALHFGYIRVSGIRFEQVADGLPIPQRAAVSAMRGHHWIIEDCQVRWVNALGIDVGEQTWHAAKRPSSLPVGGHIVRRNVVAHCGICGIAGMSNIDYSLFEDNIVEDICGRDVEIFWETAGIKLHRCNGVLIRRNVIRHTRHAPGLWLDYLIINTRVTENIITDVESVNGGIYLEVAQAINLLDHNIIWDIRMVPDPGNNVLHGHGINVDTGEKSVVAYNFIGKVRNGYGVGITLNEHYREVDRRVGLGRQHQILNNIIVDCPQRILFSRDADNQCEGNLYDTRDQQMSHCIEFPAPLTSVNLAAWREFYQHDLQGSEASITATLDTQTLGITLAVEGDLPTCVPVPALHASAVKSNPGPFTLLAGAQEYRLSPAKVTRS